MEPDDHIRRATDGAIDISHYIARGRRLRSVSARRCLARWRRAGVRLGAAWLPSARKAHRPGW